MLRRPGALGRAFQTCIKTRRLFSTSSELPRGWDGPAKSRFKDRLRIEVQGGHGGSGCSSFAKLPYLAGGMPDGAPGGQGGDIYIESSSRIKGLDIGQYHFRAESGANGQSANRPGRNGADLTVHIPVGTIVHEIVSTDPITNKRILQHVDDFDEDGKRLLIVSGGQRGLGNRSFRSSDSPFAKYSSAGRPGEQKSLLLELKLIADIGLVGYPNAGKSSVLNGVSRASPKVAAYPFTTLGPFVGTVYLNDEWMSKFTVADIPGIIDGAHADRGLGLEFLRYIQRTKLLLYIIDIAETEARDAVTDFENLQYELNQYNPDMLTRPAIIFANKIDRKPKTCQKNLERLRAATDLPIVSGSALRGKNLDVLMARCRDLLTDRPVACDVIHGTKQRKR